MNYKAPAAAAAIMLCFAAPGCAQGPKALVAQAKRAASTQALERALLALGCDSLDLDTLLGAKSPDFLLAPKRLKRAETFSADLDSDPESETISQILFQGEPDEDGSYSKVYLVFVHDGKSGGQRLLFKHPFPLTFCGKTRQGGMSFRFAPGKPSSARKEVLFKSKVVESCGLQIADYELTDTLRYRDGALVFQSGAPQEESTLDHMNPP